MKQGSGHLIDCDDRKNLAADYAVRIHSGDISPEDQQAMEQWLQQNPDNRTELQAFLDTWHSLGALADRKASISLPVVKRRYGSWAMAASVLLAVCAGLLFIGKDSQSLQTPQLATYQTGVGEQKEFVLDDGSHVTLNTNTRLLVDFSEGKRNVILNSGEAFFEVAHDKARPFTVGVGSRAVTVLGTRFDVRQSGFDLDVAVLEGSVAVHSRGDIVTPLSDMFDVSPGLVEPQSDEKYRLSAGVTAHFSGTPGADNMRVEVAELDPNLASPDWKRGLIAFNNKPLYQVVKEFNRYLDKKILIEDSQIMNLKISGVFQLTAIDAAMARMEDAFPVTITNYSDRTVMTGRNR